MDGVLDAVVQIPRMKLTVCAYRAIFDSTPPTRRFLRRWWGNGPVIADLPPIWRRRGRVWHGCGGRCGLSLPGVLSAGLKQRALNSDAYRAFDILGVCGDPSPDIAGA